jgi:hypothetical protein
MIKKLIYLDLFSIATKKPGQSRVLKLVHDKEENLRESDNVYFCLCPSWQPWKLHNTVTHSKQVAPRISFNHMSLCQDTLFLALI